MTDLNHIWSEYLDRKAVLKRADEDETPIDPSEDLQQFDVLLSKIEEGLQNEPGSQVSISTKTRDTADSLELTVTSKLPSPLEPLKWKLHLAKEPQSSTTSHLLLPFINAETDQEARQQFLIEELHKKDWVLAKLFDKLEGLGIDLTTIFPGTSGLRGRKGLTLTQAAKYIRGLAPFDEESWREEVSTSSPISRESANIVAELSVGSPRADSLKPAPDAWWKTLRASDTSTSLDAKMKQATKSSTDSLETETDAGSETGNDEFEVRIKAHYFHAKSHFFQRQETPPRFKKPSGPQKSPSTRNGEDEETQSENGEVVSPKRRKEAKHKAEDSPPAIRPKAAPSVKLKGMGTIGGKKQIRQKSPSPSAAPTPSPSPSPAPSRTQSTPSPPRHRKHESSEGLTDYETDSGDTDADPEPRHTPLKANTRNSSEPAPKPSRKLGLGVIGGKKKKQPTPTPETEPGSEENGNLSKLQSHSPDSQPPPKKKKPLGRIGAIGGLKPKAKPLQDSSSQWPTSSRTEVGSPPAKTKEDLDDTEDEAEKKEETRSQPSPPKKKNAMKRETPMEPAREETEEEKANRKREELKRQLEAKSKAPAKKKRRF
ncbi:uncharacterized protein DSM5745_11452 [Aspergillus mulundensis]|uniref:Non-homologous end-joining factor 1 n=1 Tax=Aspergillus mulundensis TaxID=1810919 RepID=A0A3D8Q795_9EURO|nr:hypothetical protein DSM5745_11452 [Aspergillus mulundensis]RDW57557.1 hypothetical protein DSM5745_11452 [Aspergillus mulundensis]